MKFSRRFRSDLIQEAKTELDFLALVDDFPSLYAGPVLKNAIRRYEMFWLPLAAREGSASRLLAAPLDIAWVWHLHMLSPQDYEQDCMNIASHVVDHLPMNRYLREQGLQNARYLWEKAYPTERFEVDLNYPTPFTMPYRLKIRYDIEKASSYQSKFYYQVSLAHFTDSKFLASAVKRYEHHLHLKSQRQKVCMIPCTDIELIWHAHLHHPLNYKQVTSEMFGAIVNPGSHESSLSLGITSHDSERGTRVVWSAAGFQYDKLGAVYRGDLPHPRPPRPNGIYASLRWLQYVMYILQVEVLNVDVSETFTLRIYDPSGGMIVDIALQGGNCINMMSQCIIDNESQYKLTVSLHQKAETGFERVVGSSVFSMLSFMDACPYGAITELPWVFDIPFSASRAIVRLSAKSSPSTFKGYRFKVQPDPYFAEVDHPSVVLSFPQSMFSPRDFAKTYLPCESATHSLLDCRGQEAFKCRVVHSTEGLLSAVEIISLDGVVVASAHTMDLNTLPDKAAIEDHTRCAYMNHVEGERAMPIRSRKDWAICFGKWQRGKMFSRSPWQVKFRLFKIHGAREWCEVRKDKGGLYYIYLGSGSFLHFDLERGAFFISPSAQDIPEIIALAFSVSIVYMLCKSYKSTPRNESAPSLHQKATSDKVTPMLLAAGYKSTMVPTNVYLTRSPERYRRLQAGFAGSGGGGFGDFGGFGGFGGDGGGGGGGGGGGCDGGGGGGCGGGDGGGGC